MQVMLQDVAAETGKKHSSSVCVCVRARAPNKQSGSWFVFLLSMLSMKKALRPSITPEIYKSRKCFCYRAATNPSFPRIFFFYPQSILISFGVAVNCDKAWSVFCDLFSPAYPMHARKCFLFLSLSLCTHVWLVVICSMYSMLLVHDILVDYLILVGNPEPNSHISAK